MLLKIGDKKTPDFKDDNRKPLQNEGEGPWGKLKMIVDNLRNYSRIYARYIIKYISGLTYANNTR